MPVKRGDTPPRALEEIPGICVCPEGYRFGMSSMTAIPATLVKPKTEVKSSFKACMADS